MSIWERVDRLIDRAESVDVLRAHKLQLLAARRWRSLGRPVPSEVVEEERVAAVISLVVPALLNRIRAAYPGQIVLFKGPEVAARYPDPALRSFIDLDLLVDEPELAQRQLVGAGFKEAGDPPWVIPGSDRAADPFSDRQHLRPLLWPGVPLKIELHRWPNWPPWLDPPDVGQLLSAAVPSALEVDGISALPPEHHALILASHSWTHDPLAQMRDVLDVAVMAEAADRELLSDLATRWGMRHLWKSTISVADAFFLNGTRRPLSQRVWARNLDPLRERTVFESHLEGWVSGFWGAPPLRAVRLLGWNVARDLRPATGEAWKPKLARTRAALRNALSSKSSHDRQLGGAARRLTFWWRRRTPSSKD